MKELKITLGNIGFLVTELTSLIQSTGKAYRVTIKEWKEARSITANAQYYKWLPSVASFYGEDVEFIRAWMKHDIAWPIVERGNCEYSKKVRYMPDKAGYHALPHAKKVSMLDLFQVTSIMDSAQHTKLRDELQIYWAKQGLELRYLNDKK